MSHRTSSWLLVFATALVSTSLTAAQDPIPIGFSPSQPGAQPYWIPAYAPQYMPQYTMPPAPQGVMPAALHSRQPVAQAPIAAPAYPEAPVAESSVCPSCSGGRGGCGLNSFASLRYAPNHPHSLLTGKYSAAMKAHLAGLWAHPQRPGPTGIDSLPTHPYARSPRDFFMFYENLEAERSRDLRPTLIP